MNVQNPRGMRDIGQSSAWYATQAMFETNVSDGKISWMNPYALDILGISEIQASHLSLTELAPSTLSGIIAASIVYGIELDRVRNLIWPMRAADGTVVWWYVTKLRATDGMLWSRASLVAKTPESGPEFDSLVAMAETVVNHNELELKFQKYQQRSEREVEILSQMNRDLKAHQMGQDSAFNQMSREVRELRHFVQNGFSDHTEEILRLISTDKIHSGQIEKFDKHAKETETRTIIRISDQAELKVRAVEDKIDRKAVEAGKAISKKLTLPISIIASVVTATQWIIQHWGEIQPHVSAIWKQLW